MYWTSAVPGSLFSLNLAASRREIFCVLYDINLFIPHLKSWILIGIGSCLLKFVSFLLMNVDRTWIQYRIVAHRTAQHVFGIIIWNIGIMNLLEDRLKNSSAGIILDTIKVFINFATISKQEFLIKEVITRIQGPVITLMASSEVSGTYELTYVILT